MGHGKARHKALPKKKVQVIDAAGSNAKKNFSGAGFRFRDLFDF
jgi:hypothetical protein